MASLSNRERADKATGNCKRNIPRLVSLPNHKEPGLLADLWDIARIPILLALLAVSATWMVWYFTTEPSDPKAVRPTECDWDKLEKCFSLNLVNKMFTHGAIAGGAGGVSFYVMLRRERLAREAAERRAEEERQQAQQERQRADEIQRRAEEERQQLINRIDEAHRRADEDRRRVEEDRQQLMNRLLELTAPSNGGQAQADSETD